MANNFWAKLYIEMLDDPKVGRLSDSAFRTMVNVFLLAKERDLDGYLPEFDDMAWRLRKTDEELKADLAELAKVGIVEKLDEEGLSWFVPQFAKRQAKVTGAERQAAYRKRQYQAVFEEEDNVTEETTDDNKKEAEFVTMRDDYVTHGVTNRNKVRDEVVTNRNTEKEEEKETEKETEKEAEAEKETDFGGCGCFDSAIKQKTLTHIVRALENTWNMRCVEKYCTQNLDDRHKNDFMMAFESMAIQQVLPKDLERALQWYQNKQGFMPSNPERILKPALREAQLRKKAREKPNVSKKSEFDAYIQR